jgi:hypothetical protein
MDLPWFDRKQGDIYEAMSQARVNAALRDEVQVNSLHDLANAYLQLRPIEAAVAQYEAKIVPLARQTEQLLRDPNVAQTLDPVDISDQLRKLVQIRLKHLELRYQHNLIRTQLELLLGRRLTARADEPRRLQPPPPEEVMPQGGDTPLDQQSRHQHGESSGQRAQSSLTILPSSDGVPAGEQSDSNAQRPTSTAEYLDASNWKPSSKARGERFRR